MSFPASDSTKIIKELQYVIQTIRTAIPDTPTFINAGCIQDFTPNSDMNANVKRKLGSADIYKVRKTGERFNFDIAFSPVDRTLISKGINLKGADATHNRDQILGFLLSQEMNEAGSLAEKYIIPIGCQCDSTTIDVTLEDVAVSQSWIAYDIAPPSTTHGLTTPTFASPISANPWNGLDGGNNPFSWNAEVKQILSFSVTSANNINQTQVVGNANVFATNPTLRDITFTVDVPYEDNDMILDEESMTGRAMELVINADTKLTFTNAFLTNHTETISATSSDIKMLTFNGVAQSLLVEDIP